MTLKTIRRYSIFFIAIAAAAATMSVSTSAWAQDDASKSKDTPKPFAVTVHIATSTPSDSDPRVKTFIDTANEHFSAAGVSFAESERKTLPISFAVLETQKERHLLKKYFVPNTINVFMVDEIDDPTPSEATKKAAAWQGRKPSGRLAGAHIEFDGKKPNTFIILGRDTDDLSFTHELGHFFGCPHEKDPSNIMSYGASRQGFNEKQLQTFRMFAGRFRKQHILKFEK